MRSLIFGSLLAIGCTHGLPIDLDAGAIDGAPSLDADSDAAASPDASDSDLATTGAVADLATTGGAMDLATTDTGADLATTAVSPPPAFDGFVTALLHVGSSYYVGGQFTRISPYRAPNILALDSSGTPTKCPFVTGFDGTVEAIVAAGGSIYVGGEFTHYRGASASYLVKIDATTCALDTTFSPPASNGFDNLVLALASSGSSLYVGGLFTAYRSIAGSANRIAKLDLATGALDTTFSPATGNGFSGGTSPQVIALAVAGGSLYAGGEFTAYRGVAGSASGIAKLDLASGALDTTFSTGVGSGFNAPVSSLATAGASIYVGGFFSSYGGVANSANGLAKLDLASGAIDTTFSPAGATGNGFSSPYVYALAVSGTSLYVGGQFINYRGVANSAINVAKLDLASGTLDTTFSPPANNGFSGRVQSLAVDGGYLYAGGQFTGYRGVADSADHLARFDAASGALDTTFLPSGSVTNGLGGGSAEVHAIIVADSTIWIGGAFQVYAGYPVNHLAKLDDSTLAVDTTFSPAGNNGFGGWVDALAATSSSLYVGGSFIAYRGVANSANYLAKLDLTSGAIDTTFSPPGAAGNGFATLANGSVRALAIAGTSIYVGGLFNAYRGVANSANSLAKLDLASGAIDDATFGPVGATSNGFEAGTQVDALAVAGSSVYVGGSFTAYRGVANSANRLAKLDLATGAIDTAFSPPGATANGFNTSDPYGQVYSLALAGTSLYVGGEFTAYRGVANSANALAKLDLASGAIDTTFSPPGASNNGFYPSTPYVAVLALAVSGGSVYAGGWEMSAYRGVPNSANALAKLDLVTGAMDTTFSPPGTDANGFALGDGVWSLAAAGGVLFVGGDLTAYRGTGAVTNFARLDLADGTPK